MQTGAAYLICTRPFNFCVQKEGKRYKKKEKKDSFYAKQSGFLGDVFTVLWGGMYGVVV
jgi:hypothetical protein